MSDTPDDMIIEMIAQNDILGKIIEALGHSDLSLFMPALRCVGNILSASDPEVVERCLWNGVLDKLTNILYQSNSTLIKECLWAFSNITAGPNAHIAKFIESDAFERIIILTESKNIDIRKESIFVLCHAVTGADLQLRSLIYEKTNGKIMQILLLAGNISDARLLF